MMHWLSENLLYIGVMLAVPGVMGLGVVIYKLGAWAADEKEKL